MSSSWNKLVKSLYGLPGVGPKMAERLAIYLLKYPNASLALEDAVRSAREKIRPCQMCGAFTEDDFCRICTDESRDKAQICVVEQMPDLAALERCRAFRGQYHILGGVLSPLDNVGPDDLRLDSLFHRVTQNNIREILLATNPTVEGEATAAYIAQNLKESGIRLSRLAYGLPSGSALEYADDITLARAVEGRQPI
jgi:recombination protein RecR